VGAGHSTAAHALFIFALVCRGLGIGTAGHLTNLVGAQHCAVEAREQQPRDDECQLAYTSILSSVNHSFPDVLCCAVHCVHYLLYTGLTTPCQSQWQMNCAMRSCLKAKNERPPRARYYPLPVCQVDLMPTHADGHAGKPNVEPPFRKLWLPISRQKGWRKQPNLINQPPVLLLTTAGTCSAG
jgi:hypothetical protein